MSRDEIKTILEANEGKRVRVTYNDGKVEAVDINSVGEKGFVHRGADAENQHGFWTSFEWLSNVTTQL